MPGTIVILDHDRKLVETNETPYDSEALLKGLAGGG
jgi:hypothetical protein